MLRDRYEANWYRSPDRRHCRCNSSCSSFSACRSAVPTVHAAEGRLAAIVIDYPLNGSIFPPEITAPAFIWRDSSEAANLWRIEVKFADGSAAMQFESRGEPMQMGEIDQRCISANNELPKLTAEQAKMHTWIPDANAWEKIKKNSISVRRR